MPNAQDVYTANVRPLPPTVEESGEWSEEDIRDLTDFSLRYADTLYPENEDQIASVRHLTFPL